MVACVYVLIYVDGNVAITAAAAVAQMLYRYPHPFVFLINAHILMRLLIILSLPQKICVTVSFLIYEANEDYKDNGS